MEKRGQISVFIILGILIVAVFAIVYVFISPKETGESMIEKTIKESVKTDPVKVYVDSCIKDVSVKALIFTGFQGGYYIANYSNHHYSGMVLPYYIDDGVSLMPSKDVIEEQISDYIVTFLPDCVDDFNSFKELGYSIEQGDINVDTVIAKESVSFNVNYPLTISSGSASTQMNDFTFDIQLELGTIYDIVKEFVDKQKQTPDMICYSCLVDLAIAYDVEFDLIKGMGDTVIFTLVDNNTRLNGENYIFVFSVRYSLDSSVFVIPVVIETIPDVELKVGESYNFAVNSSGQDIIFSDNTNIFDITSNGIISYTGQEDDLGVNVVRIDAEDSYENSAFETFIITVVRVNESQS